MCARELLNNIGMAHVGPGGQPSVEDELRSLRMSSDRSLTLTRTPRSPAPGTDSLASSVVLHASPLGSPGAPRTASVSLSASVALSSARSVRDSVSDVEGTPRFGSLADSLLSVPGVLVC